MDKEKNWDMTSDYENSTNILPFEKPVLLTGGKEPPSTANCWLDKLEEGTLFLVSKQGDFNLGLFLLLGRTSEKTTILVHKDNPNQKLYINPGVFCNTFRLYETLGVVKEEEEKPLSVEVINKEETNGDKE